MNILETLLKDKIGGIKDVLVQNTGFSAEQASAFVPDAAQKVLGLLGTKGSEFNLTDIPSSVNQLIGALDVSSIASNANVDVEKARTGLTAVLPMILELASNHKEKLGAFSGISDALSGSSIGKIASNLVNSLFK